MLIKIYTLFTVLYSNLEVYNIASVLESSRINSLTIGPPRVGVEVDNIFIAIVTFKSFKNCKVS
jgi:hypothetical protein